jgi:hypothetical protein
VQAAPGVGQAGTGPPIRAQVPGAAADPLRRRAFLVFILTLCRERRLRATIVSAAALTAAVCLAGLSACSIQEPKLPTFQTELAIPLGTLRYGVDELLRHEPALVTGQEGSLSLQFSGSIDSVAVGNRLDLAVGGRSVAASIGVITLDPAPPAAYTFRLGTLYPPAEAAQGPFLPVPPFAFFAPSPASDLPGFTRASVVAGGLDVRIHNGLPVPVGGPSPPERMELRLIDPALGSDVAALLLDVAIPANGEEERFLDLAGTMLPDSLRVQIEGGSPGSYGTPVAIDPEVALSVTVQIQSLQVDSAQAPIGARSFGDSSQVALPDSIRVLQATLASGALQLQLSSDLPLPVRARLTLPQVRDAQGATIEVEVPLAAAGTGLASVDLAQATLDFGAQPGQSLTIRTVVDTPGSQGASVWVTAGQRVAATVAPLSLSFARVVGVLQPQQTLLAQTQIDLPIPRDLPTLTLAQAQLTLLLRSAVDLPGTIDLHLEGRSDHGVVVPMDLRLDLAAGQGEAQGVRSYMFDAGNSGLLAFLDNLPVSMLVSGMATVGDGVTAGTIARGDGLVASYRIDAPLTLSLAPQTLRIDPRRLALGEDARRRIGERVLGASLQAEVSSTLPVAARVFIGLDPDSSAVHDAPRIRLGPIDLPAAGAFEGGSRQPAVATTLLALDDADVLLLADQDVYQGVRIELPGTNGQTVTLHASDGVEVRGLLRARVRLGKD